MIKLAVLISGGGTTLVNLMAHIADGRVPAEVVLVIASRPDCRGVERARELGLPCVVLARKGFPSVEVYSAIVFEQCRAAGVDLVVLGGFLSLLEIPGDFANRVMNIHPSLIPAFCGHGFYGHHIHEAVVARGVKVTGCTVHFADNQYDHGPIILQKVVPVHAEDTAEDVAARVFAAEQDAFPEAIRLFAEGRLSVRGGTVFVEGPA